MDPNQGGQKTLNPNLQAAYDRVMGLDVSGNATTPQPTTSTPVPTTPSEPATPTPSPATPVEPIPPVAPTVPPTIQEPSMPSLPTTPITPPTEPINQPPAVPVIPPTPQTTIEDTTPPNPSMDSMNAAMNMPQVIPHDTETVKIGLGGSPVGSTAKAKGKGLSPTILILGAFVFLMVYALFWVRFFNLPLPFLGK